MMRRCEGLRRRADRTHRRRRSRRRRRDLVPATRSPPRRSIVREMKRRGKIWIRIFPAKPFTHKPPETRMGSGKGNVEYYVAVVKPGRIMFEVSGLSADIAVAALRAAQYKFSIKTKVVARLGESVIEEDR